MDFRLLGPLEVWRQGRTLALGAAKQRALLAMLLLGANRVVSNDELIEALWEEGAPETAPKALQVYVSQLRKVLGRERIVTRAPGYLIRVEPGELDLERFEHLIEEGGRDRLVEALALWRGPPLADFAYRRFAQLEIGRLEELRLAALEERVEADLALGRHAELIGELEALVKEHPLRERLRGQLMVALYRSGRQAEALEAYQHARRALVDELGIDPGRALRELEQSILRQDPVLDLAAEVEPVADPRRGAFVGRETELAELAAGLEDAIAGRGRLFLLVGEPGIGKSRLADELIAHARRRGARVLVGRCWEAGGAPAYWPWVQALRSCVRERDPEQLHRELGRGASDLAQLIPELSELFPDLREARTLEPTAARFQLFDAVASFLLTVAAERPLVLVLDDLHAADEPSLLLLRYFARELSGGRLLVLGAYRDVDPTVSEPLVSAVTELVREPVMRRIQLAGLEQQDVGEYIELTAGLAPDGSLVGAIHAQTEGNPLFVGEVVRLLVSEGELGGAGDLPPAIPQGVRDAIARRLARLSEKCRDLLALASVLGREFRLEALEQTSDSTRDEVLQRLEEAVDERLITEVVGAPGRLRFSHVLVRDSLYEGLPYPRRLRLHRQAGEALERLYARDVEPYLAELAHQFLLAGGTESGKAFDYARRAADRAMAQLAFEEAVRLYRMAQEAFQLERLGDESAQCELKLSLGEAEAAAGEGAASRQSFLEAAEIARKLGAAEPLARAALGYGGRFAWPQRAAGDTKLVPLLEEALAAIGEAETLLRARLLARLACAVRDELSPERRDFLSGQAVAIARRLGDLPTLVYTLMGRRLAIWAPDNLDRLLQVADEIVQIADEAGEPERAADARLLRLEAHLIGGDIGRARSDLADAERLAVDARRPSAHWHVEVHRAELALLEGRFDDAERHIAEAAQLAERALIAETDVVAVQTFALRWARGGLAESRADIERLLEEQPAGCFYRCLLAVMNLELGSADLARDVLEALSADDFAVVPRKPEWMLDICLLIEVARALGDAERAAVLGRLLGPYGRLVVIYPHAFGTGSAARSLGVAATALESFDAAERHFEDALVLNAATGARPWLARTRHDYGRMLLARGRPGDRGRALELVEQALAGYQQLGMNPYAARASALAGGAALSIR